MNIDMSEFEETAKRVIAEEREDAVRPWRRTVIWISIAYAVLLALSILQAVLAVVAL